MRENISKEKIIELYLKGNGIRSISETMCCSYSYVHKVLRKNNLTKEKQYIPANKIILSQEQISELIKLYNEGNSLENIGNIFGISASTVVKNIKDFVKIRTNSCHKALNETQIKECIDFYEDGYSFKKIGELFGLSDVSIKKKIGPFINIREPGNKTKLNDEQVLECIEKYKNGTSLRKIASELKTSSQTIKNILSDNVKFRYNVDRKPISEELVIDLYLNKTPIIKIRKQLHCSEKTIMSILLKNNIYIRTFYENLKYSNLNHCFFEKFTKESCYWAGFIAADGNILDYNKSKLFRLAITLSLQDINHLQKFKEKINSNKKIHIRERISFSKKCFLSSLSLSSKKIVNDLIETFNILPKKSLILEPPYNIPDEFVSHFIRGYFDGDGWILKNKNKKGIGFIGTKKVTEWIKYNLQKNCKGIGNPSLYSKNEKTYLLPFNGRFQTMIILQWLYNDSEAQTRLDRKYNIYLEYKEIL
jgi:transposase-like protein